MSEAPQTRRRRSGEPRKSSTYRGARRNAGRSSNAARLKTLRLELGMSRSDFDRGMHKYRNPE